MIDMETLIKQTSEEAVSEAGNAMDLESVSNMHYNSKGRLEGAVKPAPPCTQKPAYVKITSRGNRYRVDCNIHGKPGWCLHAIVLCLHHLGRKPIYKVRRVEQEPVRGSGHQAIIQFGEGLTRMRIKNLSTGRFASHPLTLLEEVFKGILKSEGMELFQDLARESNQGLEIDPQDLAPLLSAIHGGKLFTNEGEPLEWASLPQGPPTLEVGIQGNRIHWKARPDLPSPCVFAPGWPGYFIENNVIRRFPGYVPDLSHLKGQSSGSCPLNAENLKPFLMQKHHIQWETLKPVLIRNPHEVGLHLSVKQRDLMARFGIWRNGEFFPLEDLDTPLQLLKGQPLMVLDASGNLLNRWYSDSRKVKGPWSGAGFRIREQGAARFLQEMNAPPSWRVKREEADHWFGLSPQEMTVTWKDGKPEYKVGDSVFNHESLFSGLGEGNRGVRLNDGQLLNVDTVQIRANEQMLKGVGALHQDPVARQSLITRMTGGQLLDPPPSLKEEWNALLRPYQKEGVQWMLANFARSEPSLLADDMGLGKTIQTLAFFDHIRGHLPQLIVAPTSLLQNWRSECLKFSPHRSVTIHHGPSRTKDPETLSSKDLVLTSYGVVRQDLELLYDVEFQIVALDEAQAIKNPDSQTAKAVCELWCEHRLAISGTPVENRLLELWSLFQFLAPGYLGEQEEWRNAPMPGSARFRAIQAQTGPFLKRRLKTRVEPDLPTKQEITVTLPLLDGQANLYQTYLRGARQDAKSGDAMSILTKLLRLRQICCHPGLVDQFRFKEDSNKLAFLMEQLEEVVAEGHAVLVFSQFTSLLKRIQHELEENDYASFYLDGKTRDRAALVDRFQEGERPIFLISLKAGGTGLNLTRASYVYHLDPWWNPMVEAQATDRAHRIGQTQKVFSYKLVSQGTVEEKILKLQARKRLLAEGLWDEEALGKLDRETMLELLM